MSAASVLPVEPALLRRLRSAGEKIAWRPAPTSPGDRRARVAHLHDEEARIEERHEPPGETWFVDSGPVGALVLLLESDRRGGLASVQALAAGVDSDFPSGALAARWNEVRVGNVQTPELVALARYALR
ncbi:MAG: hypothetical protein ACREB9_02350 [Thermoplasmata archaeon]